MSVEQSGSYVLMSRKVNAVLWPYLHVHAASNIQAKNYCNVTFHFTQMINLYSYYASNFSLQKL